MELRIFTASWHPDSEPDNEAEGAQLIHEEELGDLPDPQEDPRDFEKALFTEIVKRVNGFFSDHPFTVKVQQRVVLRDDLDRKTLLVFDLEDGGSVKIQVEEDPFFFTLEVRAERMSSSGTLSLKQGMCARFVLSQIRILLYPNEEEEKALRRVTEVGELYRSPLRCILMPSIHRMYPVPRGDYFFSSGALSSDGWRRL